VVYEAAEVTIWCASNPGREFTPPSQAKRDLMRALFTEIWQTLKETGQDWVEDNASRLAAALAYYSLLSLAPLLVIMVALLGAVLGADAAQGQIVGELGRFVGREAAEGIQSVMLSAQSPRAGIISTIIGAVTLFVGASSMFVELQSALNAVWEVAPKPGRALMSEFRTRLLSFLMVLCVAIVLLGSLVLSAVLSAVGGAVVPWLPGGDWIWQFANFVVSFAISTSLFAVIFKFVPDAEIRWADVWVGAGVTALLFTIGKALLGLYLGRAAIGSSYGAAGSLIALVVWVYYAAQILFLGAEFTQVQARRRGREIKPARNAIRVERAGGVVAPASQPQMSAR
jgi:membrane protein